MRNELGLPKSVDDSRLIFDEEVVMSDALRTRSNRFGISPSDLPTTEAGILLGAIREGDPQHDEELLRRASKLAMSSSIATTDERLRDYLDEIHASDAVSSPRGDALVSTCAARLRQVAHIGRAEEAEIAARAAVTADPTIHTRSAYADALKAVNAAHTETPTRRRTLGDIMDTVRQRRLASQGNRVVGIYTPTYPQLSDAFCGWRGLTLLAAMPGIGKTTLAMAAALDAVEANPEVCMLFVSFEMPTETLAERTISQMSGIAQRTLRLGGQNQAKNADGLQLTDAQMLNLENAERRLLALGDRIALVGKTDIGTLGGRGDDGRGCMAKLERLVADLKHRSKAARSFVVVDHFGAIPVEPKDGSQWANDTERARYLLSGLVTLRDHLGEDNPIVVVAQSRKADYGKPDLASIIGTADSGYAADAVVSFRYSDAEEKPNPDSPISIIASVDKGRDMMRRCEITMSIDPKNSRLVEVVK